MLYTRKGDSGVTKVFDTAPGQGVSKASCQTTALGSIDELNSYLGYSKAVLADSTLHIAGMRFYEILHKVQNTLFIVQAELAGAPKKLEHIKVREIEIIIGAIESRLPPLTAFTVAGGTKEAAMLDFARTIARRAERETVSGVEAEEYTLGAPALAYLNRLSSLLFALARLSNRIAGVKEEHPTYE